MTNEFDNWLDAQGPVALFIRDHLEPVQGEQGVIFPPTFAPPKGDDVPAYVIDGEKEDSVAIIDTVGSQANRIEPIFKEVPYSKLVPQAVIRIKERRVDLLDAGHRAADALVRFSSKSQELATAFRELADTGSALKLAKIAPTSLVFGVWDSRGSQVKLPRLLGSTVRAFNVQRLTRSAQYISAFEKEETETMGLTQDALSAAGMSDAPSGRGLGGVLAKGGVVREAILNLVALRAVSAGDPDGTKKLQRYLLGLGMVGLTAPFHSYLREGCLLVNSPGKEAERQIVLRNGKRESMSVDAAGALRYAEAAALDFGVGPDWEADFDGGLLKKTADDRAEKTKAKKSK